MKTILLITTSYPVKHNGSESAGIFVSDFALELSRKCNVIVMAPAGEARTIKANENLNIYYFQAPKLPLSTLRLTRLRDMYAIIATLVNGKRLANKILSNTNISHILALWALPSGFWARNNKNVPYSIWALGSDIWSLRSTPFVRTILSRTLRRSHQNFADGYKLADDVRDISGKQCEFLPSTRHITPNHIKIYSKSPPYTLTYIGRWHHNKGIDLLLTALSQLNDDDWSRISCINIAGGGPLENMVKESIRKLQSEGRPITLHGYMNTNQVSDLLASTDYLIIPSRIESIPVVFSDAMKCKCPVISTPVGDLPEILSEYRVGILAGDCSSAAITTAVKSALSMAPSTFCNDIQVVADMFQLENIVDKFLKDT